MKAAILALTLGLMAATAASAAQPVLLRDVIADNDGRITLGDLFEGAGGASGVVVQVVRPGANTILDAGLVQRAAMNAGLSWANERGLRRIVVRPGAVAAPAANGVEALTYTRSLAAGEVVGPNDLAWTRVVAAPADAPRDSDDVIGLAAKRPLRAGTAVAQRDVTAPQVIKKDDVVAVSYSADGLSLTLQAKALKAAAAGDMLEVMNPSSKKVIQALVTGPGQAVIGPAALRLKSSAQIAYLR